MMRRIVLSERSERSSSSFSKSEAEAIEDEDENDGVVDNIIC